MSETTTPRLMAAAKEFNIGKDTLVAFLAGKGFDGGSLGPASKLTEDMYYALQKEFQGDKVAKQKSNAVELPKGAEAKKKKDEEDLSIKDKPKKVEPPKEEPKPIIENAVIVKEEVPVVEINKEQKATVRSEEHSLNSSHT